MTFDLVLPSVWRDFFFLSLCVSAIFLSLRSWLTCHFLKWTIPESPTSQPFSSPDGSYLKPYVSVFQYLARAPIIFLSVCLSLPLECQYHKDRSHVCHAHYCILSVYYSAWCNIGVRNYFRGRLWLLFFHRELRPSTCLSGSRIKT